jgi:queuine tRNA-ribosyltransferase
MPVATQGAVKGLTVDDLEQAGASIMLANLYHLALRPGIDSIEELGGVHAGSGWRRPILTDSGGYQVFSLSTLRAVDDEGVRFRSHLDGSPLSLTPASVVGLQERMGVDIAMMLDECPPWPVSEEEAEAALRRTNLWARKAREASRSSATALFGIAQGSFYPRLREIAIKELIELDFEGYALGGVSVGEGTDLSRSTVERFAPLLPPGRPRYLMGVGTPADILHAVRSGIDLFDCVLPTRNARHGVAFIRGAVLRIKNARFRDDPRPLDEECECPACRTASRAFIHHLVRSRHQTGAALVTLHNVRFYLDFMADLRQALASGSSFDSVAGVASSDADSIDLESDSGSSRPTNTDAA